MIIYPAIDLLDGQCVRLIKGDFEQKTVYSSNPQSLVQTFETAGAKALHLVDLSGAKNPAERQLPLIRSLVKLTRLKIQCGGGIRSSEDVKTLLDVGVDRVVLGSIAVSKPELLKNIVREFGPDRITLAMDVAKKGDDYFIAINGWKTITSVRAIDLISDFQRSVSPSRILCTDIGMDGMMQGPNVELYRSFNGLFPRIEFQASGGVSKIEDLRALEKIGTRSAVVGKAIYEGSLSLKEALQEFQRGPNAH